MTAGFGAGKGTLLFTEAEGTGEERLESEGQGLGLDMLHLIGFVGKFR